MVWRDTVSAVAAGTTADAWISAALGLTCRLVYRHDRLHAAFGPDDLEDEEDTHDDIAGYLRLRLASSEKNRGDNPESIAAAADRVATRANGVFLYARIVSRTLQERDRLHGSNS